MNPRAKPLLKYTLTIALAALAIGFTVRQARRSLRTGETGARIWFYDQSEQRLYAVPNDTLPPHKGIGGQANDGVRAVVIAFQTAEKDLGKTRIAYLETYTPELKALLEKARQNRGSRNVSPAVLPPRDSDYFQTNTLVKRPEETTWHPSASPEARDVLSAWRAWRGPNGHAPVICVP